MSSVVVERPSANPYLDRLQHLLQGSQERPDCLVVAHYDNVLIRRLSVVLRDAAVLLPISQSAWDFAGALLPEAISWGLNQGDFRRLVLVGHSQAAAPPASAMLVGQADRNPGAQQTSTRRGYNLLLEGARRSQQQQQQAKELFATQLQLVAQIPTVRERLALGELQLSGLFYLTESGVFLAFDSPNS